MKVIHWAPFAPFRCGLYEAARDMAHADAIAGHDVKFCDLGVPEGRDKPRPQGDPEQLGGKIDDRAGWQLVTSGWACSHDADLWICHDGIPSWVSERNLVPQLWIVHGRPIYSWRLEVFGGWPGAFSLHTDLALRRRTFGFVTMWPELVPVWSSMSAGKLRCIDHPCLDLARYSHDGPKYEIKKESRGELNILICDTEREDIGCLEVATAALEAARSAPGRVKVHFWAIEEKHGPAWQPMFQLLRQCNGLGEIHGREPDIEKVFRAMDVMASPHRIGTRTLLEALACGLEVVSDTECRYTRYQADPRHTADYTAELLRAMDQRRSPEEMRRPLEPCGLGPFGARMSKIYDAVLHREATHAV